MKLLVATSKNLIMPTAWLDHALTHYKIPPPTELVITCPGQLNRWVYDYQRKTMCVRIYFSPERVLDAVQYSDGALFIWDGADSAVNTLRNWMHAQSKPYIDWILPTQDYTK